MNTAKSGRFLTNGFLPSAKRGFIVNEEPGRSACRVDTALLKLDNVVNGCLCFFFELLARRSALAAAMASRAVALENSMLL